jgi:HEAT repeat protein
MKTRLLLSVVALLVLSDRVHPQDKGSLSSDTDNVKALLETAKNDKNLLTRTAAVDALGKLKVKNKKDLAKELSGLLSDTTPEKLQSDNDAVVFATHVVQALGGLGPDAQDELPRIVKVKGYEASLNAAVDTAVQAIQPSLKDDSARKGVEDLLKDLINQKTVTARLTAAKALGQFADSDILKPLSVAAATDPDSDVRLLAAESFKKVAARLDFDRKHYVDSLITMLDGSLDVTIRMMAAKKLGDLGKDAQPAIDDLTKASNDPDPDLKSVAANALKRIPSKPKAKEERPGAAK